MSARTLTLFSALTLGFLLGVPFLTHAQSSEGLKITPAIIEDRVDPGQSYQFVLKVTNIADTARTFYLAKDDITGLTDQGLPVFADDTQERTEYELSSWIELSRSSVVIDAGGTVEVPFTVRVPRNVTPGSHFGGIFFDAKPPEAQTTGASVSVRVGGIISLRVSGDVLEEVRLREFSTNQFVYDTPPVDFMTKVENLGNVLVRPHGLVEITDMFGRKVGAMRVNDSGGPVFPKGVREYKTTWEYEEFAFGRYQALLSLSYGEEAKRTIVKATSFWVLPLKPILITLGVLLGLVLLVYLSMRAYIRRKLREMGVTHTNRGNADLYERRYKRPISRLTIAVFLTLLLCVVFLVLLFVMFS